MDVVNRIKLAQYHNARLVRMKRCAATVDTCGHRKAFEQLAESSREARDHQMRMVRVETGRRKSFLYQIETLGFEEGGYAEVSAVDELEDGAKFEAECERVGVDPGICRVSVICRVRL
ncbi:hypothetical protein [uncultured Sphingomonas sp.]|uniref:hypothetical protein n=1 Tax=uncultured Sphingomonas sp. TaxID=158754 RepID=UPI002598876D|nr:hypothetical protein [uncultured Sphingomonas sp.]